LVCFDGSPGSLLAVKHAVVLAKPQDWLYLMTVFAKPVQEVKEIWMNASQLIAEAEAVVHQLDPNRRFRSFIRVNSDPSNEILEFSAKSDCDYIVMGARGLSNIKAMLLGSVSSFVVHRATVPVLIVHDTDQARRLLAVATASADHKSAAATTESAAAGETPPPVSC